MRAEYVESKDHDDIKEDEDDAEFDNNIDHNVRHFRRWLVQLIIIITMS